jgi:hypothetical protein
MTAARNHMLLRAIKMISESRAEKAQSRGAERSRFLVCYHLSVDFQRDITMQAEIISLLALVLTQELHIFDRDFHGCTSD